MRVQQESNGAVLSLAGEPLGRGGEADIFAVDDQPQLVAKIYRQPTATHAQKLKTMIARPPQIPGAGSGHNAIAWPTDRLLTADVARAVVGFLMPRVEKSLLFQQVQHPRSRQSLAPNFSCMYLLRTARNLAAAVKAIHDAGHVVGDLNESNIFVTSSALVTLVDTDSFQIGAAGQVFRCRVGKVEYTAPELQHQTLAEIDRTPAHDNFGLAVLIFQLLMQGVHPFGGAYTGESLVGGVGEWIAKGWWPYSLLRDVPFRPRPAAPPWDVLPPQVQTLFLRCFDTGHTKPDQRPTAREWTQALTEAEGQLQECPANRLHFFPRQSEICPWCRMAKEQGRDPFPLPPAAPAASLPIAQVPLPPSSPTPTATAPSNPPAPTPTAPRRSSRGFFAFLLLLLVTAAGAGYWFNRERLDPLIAGWFGRSGASPTVPDSKPAPATPVVAQNAFFNGRNTDGWQGLPQYWKAENGTLTASTVPGGIFAGTALCSAKKYRDFELKFQVRLKGEKAASGVHIRAEVVSPEDFHVEGPLADIGQENWGRLYNVRFVGNVMAAVPKDVLTRVLKIDDFNDYEIKCVGKRVTIKLNGAVTVDSEFPELPAEGVIAWRLPAGPPMEASFRNIQFSELEPPPPSGYEPLFNGKDLTGWKPGPTAKTKWEIKDGILIGSGPVGFLYSNRDDYENFRFRIEARINAAGDSGQYFRTTFPTSAGGGYEAQICLSGDQKTGSLYNIVKVADALHQPDEWFTQEVIARGDHIIIRINDKQVVDTRDKSFARGNFALQVWGGSTVVQFRKIEVKEFPPGQLPDSATVPTDPPKAKALSERGRAAIDAKELDRAMELFNEALGLDPMLAGAYRGRGACFFRKKQYDRAVAEFNQALELDPKDFWNYLGRADSFQQKNFHDLAIADYSEAIRLDPKVARPYRGRGWAYSLKNDFRRALDDLTEAVRLDSKDAVNFNDRGRVYLQQKQYAKAIDDLNEAIRLNSTFSAPHINLGVVYRDQKEYDPAISEFSKAITLDPKSPFGFNHRGWVHYMKRDYKPAIDDYTEAIKLDPTFSLAYSNRGVAFKDKREYDKAIADFSEAIKLAPQWTVPLNNRGATHALNREHDKAIEDFTAAIKLNSKSGFAFYNRGASYEARGELDKAIADFAETIALEPKNAEAYNFRGVAHQRKKEYDKAIADFTEAIKLSPRFVAPLNNRAACHVARQEHDKAIDDFTAVLTIDSKSVFAYMQRGINHEAKGESDKAIADFTEVIKLQPKNANAYLERSKSYAKKGNKALADADHAKAKELEVPVGKGGK